MPTDFTVIHPGRQHFGDNQGTFKDVEPDLQPNQFVNQEETYTFNCPNINSAEIAVLMFQSRDVDHQKNIFKVNGAQIPGGLPASPNRDTWNGNIMLVDPLTSKLKATNNVLQVESRNASGGSSGDIDDFILDNMVIMYKTRTPLPTNQV
jgi:hypothetical protein